MELVNARDCVCVCVNNVAISIGPASITSGDVVCAAATG